MKKSDSYVIKNDKIKDTNKVGYIRVSTAEQNEERQIESMKKLDLYRIYVEKISAKDTNRPLLKEMLDYVREGDIIYINDFSRLARSNQDLLNITSQLEQKGIKLISLKENIDTSTPNGKLMLNMIGSINEFERSILLERQREGIEIAKSKGLYKGRKAVNKPDNFEEIYNLYLNRKITGTEAISRTGLKRNTFYKFINELKETE